MSPKSNRQICLAKIPHATVEEAQTHLRGLGRSGTLLCAYLCPRRPHDLGRHYHVGHLPFYLRRTSTERLLGRHFVREHRAT